MNKSWTNNVGTVFVKIIPMLSMSSSFLFYKSYSLLAIYLTIVCQVADAPLDYETYLKEAEQLNVLQHEIEFVKSLKKIAVLNTSVFFALDYYGNKDGFYDNAIKNQ